MEYGDSWDATALRSVKESLLGATQRTSSFCSRGQGGTGGVQQRGSSVRSSSASRGRVGHRRTGGGSSPRSECIPDAVGRNGQMQWKICANAKSGVTSKPPEPLPTMVRCMFVGD